MNQSIFRGMLISYILVFLFALCAVGLFMSYFTRDYIVDSKKQELLRKAKKVNLTIQGVKKFGEVEKATLIFLDQSFDARIWVFDLTGTIVATSAADEVNVGKTVDQSIRLKVKQGEEVVKNLKFDGLTEPTLSAVVPWGVDNEMYGGIVLHASVKDIDETVSRIREMILWVTLLGMILVAVMVYYISWSISRPLQNIHKVVSKIGMGDYKERIHVEAKNEIGELAATINNMAEKLETIDYERDKQEKIRKDFLANVSHELRTPLTAVQGFLEALQDGLIDGEARQKYYKIIYNECIHMRRLVEDIMDLTRLENNEIVLTKQQMDISSLLHKIAFKFEREASEKGVSIELHTADELPNVHADPIRIEQILNNIVKNAVKFTEKGKIEISAYKDRDMIHLAVSDTGIGISESDQELIWERFFKVDRGRSKENIGTGLGLAIVKELIELHGGTISLESEINRGTTVHIRIPWR
ncbi:sensor histidine kinase [Paenibacillus alkalitolerans]|uniref:sensor histidine kinase n=1 Tax=Paenibacillus alkalitolerans TaxID=2799335 RepID=UPI0018F694EE|nr:ATP-binding protein [Paenibacillus alkalitolerans]